MARLATPGVYLVEKNAFTSSVVAVPTAVPAFIGYTEKAIRNKTNLTMKPTRITSFPEFMELFGGAPYDYSTSRPFTQYDIEADPVNQFAITNPTNKYYLFSSIRMFYNNGGGNAYIISVGSYGDEVQAGKMQEGIDLLLKEQEPTMLVIPDAVLLEKADCNTVQQAMLIHCGAKTRSRISILDVHEGYIDRRDQDVINEFREGVGNNFLDFGVAYYPWLNTTITEASEIDYRNIANTDDLVGMLMEEAAVNFPDPVEAGSGPSLAEQVAAAKAEIGKLKDDGSNMDAVVKKIGAINAEFGKAKGKDAKALTNSLDGIAKKLQSAGGNEPTNEKYLQAKAAVQALASGGDPTTVGQTLKVISPLYKAILKELRHQINILPPSGAMAGIYSMTDAMVGVHKAPANVSVSACVSPTVVIGNNEQEDLNVPLNGKAVNVIRSFIGKGILVWGARTLDGNSQDWRYVGVRRTMIMIEQSIKYAIESFVFEANNARTWIKVRTSIENFLTTVWQAGALAGTSTSDAYDVTVGLGTTMTPEDILEGIMRVSVKVAITRPAEFIVITFQQKMQES